MRKIERMFVPAFSGVFYEEAAVENTPSLLNTNITSDWMFKQSTGKGVKVAIVDSGVDAAHPSVAGVERSAAVLVEDGQVSVEEGDFPDLYGHGTACAGIIRSLAPDVEIWSVRVLGNHLSGTFDALMAGIKWSLDQGADICNLSLGTTNRAFIPRLTELTERAFFKKTLLVVAANNMAMPSFPSMLSSVISVASHTGTDPQHILANPCPPVDFGAPGVQISVPWLDGQSAVVTGNSYAAPHVTARAALIKSNFPHLTPPELKALLRASCANVTSSP